MPDSVEIFSRVGRSLVESGKTTSDFDLSGPTLQNSFNGLRPAGVLIPLIQRERGINVILTKRASNLKHHAGQVSFPGGKLEKHDGDARSAALREAREEIGLSPDNVAILGRCPDHRTVTGFLISPFVAAVLKPFAAAPQVEEVEEIFETPFELIADPRNYRVESRVAGGQRRRFYVVDYGPQRIWGATAMILHGLATRLSA